jgi:hypothetical protein
MVSLFCNFTYMKGISQDFSDCGLHNDKYTKYSPNKNCVNRTFIESLRTYEKFKISERKMNFFKRLNL